MMVLPYLKEVIVSISQGRAAKGKAATRIEVESFIKTGKK